jgi:DNA-binding GntR family transcriptional regulator
VNVFLLARPYVHKRTFRKMMVDGHTAILDAIAAGDVEGAATAAVDHVQTSYERVIDSYEPRDGDSTA